jgi:CopA family copper-resistance protein
VRPAGDAAYTIFAQSEDRTGFARGTLSSRLGLSAAVPAMDPRTKRTMMDMGGMGNMSGMAGMKMDGGSMAADNPTSGATMAGMPEMHKSIPGMTMGNGSGMTPFPQPGPNTQMAEPASDVASEEVKLEPSNPVKLRIGPQVAQVTMMAMSRLDDPGAGLADNGRRVLTYADLRARYRGVDGRPPTREIELQLSGNMERFVWGFNGKKFSSAEPIELKLGERVRFVLINDSMMEHPIHLHGLWSELENGHGAFNPYKHTIIVKPAERVSYLVSADTPGKWAYHCHLLFHMHMGMFRTVVVS